MKIEIVVWNGDKCNTHEFEIPVEEGSKIYKETYGDVKERQTRLTLALPTL